MTAADALSVQPAVRPEPSAARPAASESKTSETKASEGAAKSFADVLGAETSETTDTTEAVEKPAKTAALDDASTHAAIIAAPTQVPLPPVAPVAISPAAILAGLDPDAPAGDNLSKAPAIDGPTAAPAPEFALDMPAPVPAAAGDIAAAAAAAPAAAPAAGKDTPPAVPVEQQVITQQVAASARPAAIAPEKPAARKDAKVDTSDAAVENTDAGTPDAPAESANAKPVATAPSTQPVVTAGWLPAPEAPVEPAPQPTSGPGVERAAATNETASATAARTATAGAKPAAADGNPLASANKAVQSAALANDAAPDLKIDVAASNIASTSASEALSASRTSGVETSKAAQASPAAQAAPAATIQVYSRMIERFDGRAQRFEIRLDPAELGRVDVRIEVGADKKVHAVLAAHDSAALSDLMRGQRALETSLRQAGIDVADGGIKFELSSDSGRNLSNGANQGDADKNANAARNVWRNFSTIEVAADAGTASAARPWRSSRLDLVA